MLLLAMSCLQSRTQDAAFDVLSRHVVEGLQLTPGNLPSQGFRDRVAAFAGATRLHHGFAWDHYRQRVYDESGALLLRERDRSVHPPHTAPYAGKEPCVAEPMDWLRRVAPLDPLLETMYPGYVLGCGAELELAMDLGLRLAVDVSHLHLQRAAGVLSSSVERRLLEYARVEEVHVSANDGRSDRHALLQRDTPGLDWARARLADLPVVLESYWHRTDFDEQRRQIDLLRGASLAV